MKKAEVLGFNEEKHLYTLDGKPLVSVTQTIHASVPTWKAGEWYLGRGSAVHRSIQLHLAGQLDWDDWEKDLRAALPVEKAEAILGRTRAAIKFMSDLKLKVIATEERLASDRWQYAGCIDLVAGDDSATLCLADWKSAISPEVELQLAAYRLLWKENRGEEINRACAVQTMDSGEYKLKWLDKRQLINAGNTFLSFLTVQGWLAKNRLLPKTVEP